MLLQNLLEPCSQIAKDICRICHHFQLDDAIIFHSIELFDKFNENLLRHARQKQLIFLDQNSIIDLSISSNFGVTLLNIINQNCCLDYLYWIILQNDCKKNIRDLYVHNYARTLCIITCVFISAKLFSNEHYPKMKNIIHFLYSIQIPNDFCQPAIIRLVEQKILKLINFDLNIKPLNIYIETLLSIIIRFLMIYEYINEEHFQRLIQISNLITQNFYILKLTILLDLFEKNHLHLFCIESLENIIQLEQLNRSKMLNASGIVAATFYMANSARFNENILQYLSEITCINQQLIKKSRDVIIKYTI